MFNDRVPAWLIVLCMLWSVPTCKAKSQTPSPESRPNQAQREGQKNSESPDEKSCRVFVQKFYDWRVSLLISMFCPNPLKGTAADQESIDRANQECKVVSEYRNAEKLSLDQVLAPKLRHYLKLEEKAQGNDDPGLDFDPYLNTQDSSPKFVVDNVRITGNRCDAVVHGYDDGQPREEVMPELSKTNGRWIIENFHYKFDQDGGKPPRVDDLIHMIREYIGEIKYPSQ